MFQLDDLALKRTGALNFFHSCSLQLHLCAVFCLQECPQCHSHWNSKLNKCEINAVKDHIPLIPQGYASANLPPLGSIKILGVATHPSSLAMNGSPLTDFDYDSFTQVLTVDNISIKMDEKFTLSRS